MARFLHSLFCFDQRKCRSVILALIWFLGLLCGIGSLGYTGHCFSGFLRTSVLQPGSRGNLLIISLLPFLFSAFAVYLQRYELCAVICLIKAWLFGLMAAGYCFAFHSAGWLITSLVLFRDSLCQIFLWWFWFSHYPDRQSLRPVCAILCFIAVFLSVALDYCCISPFLAGFIEF